MTKRSKFVQIMTVFFLITALSFSNNVYAMNVSESLSAHIEEKIYGFIDDTAQSELFYDWTGADVIVNDVYSYTKDDLKVYRIDIMKNDLQLGYILSDELGNILSYSRNG